MPVDFKNSETLQNLMRAFAGESQARNRYTFAAGICRQQKLHVVETAFQFTADQEKEHAEIFWNHMKEVSGETIHISGGYPAEASNNVEQLLRSAQHNEYEEHDPVYKSFAETARKEGFASIATSFEMIAEIEKMHGDRFGRFADLLETDKLFAAEDACGWLCLNCGHVHQGIEAPDPCPVCQHDQGYFIRLSMVPFIDCKK